MFSTTMTAPSTIIPKSFAPQHEAGDDIVLFVLACQALPRRAARFDGADIFDQKRRSAPLCDDNIADIVSRLQQADSANQVLLLAFFDVAAAGIGASAVQ